MVAVAVAEYFKLFLLVTLLVGSSAFLPHRSSRISIVLCTSPSTDEEDTPIQPDEIVKTTGSPEPIPRFERQQPPPPLSANDMMRALGTSPRRITLGVLSASGIALAGNFLGVTSRLLTALPEETVEKSQLDLFFPRGDFKRCRSKGYTFLIPKEWVPDISVELAKAQQRIQPLDYSMNRGTSTQQPKAPTTFPDAAYGPVGRLNRNGVSESGDTNLSVIVNTGLKGFSLEGTLGSPQSAAETLLRISIAPEGSGRVATLLNSVKDVNRNAYQFEYILDRGTRGPPLRNIAVIVGSPKGDAFYTLTVVAPAKEWEKEAAATKLRKIANSFHLTGSLS